MVGLLAKQSPEKNEEEIRAEVEMEFMERGRAIPSAIDMDEVPQRPEPIQQEGPLPTAPVKLLEQPAPQPELPKQDHDAIKEACIQHLRPRRVDVVKDAEEIAAAVGKIQ